MAQLFRFPEHPGVFMPAWLMMAPWNFSCPATDWRIWKNRQVSAPWAMAW